MSLLLPIARRLATLAALLMAVSLASYLAVATTSPSTPARPVTISEQATPAPMVAALEGYADYVADVARGDLGRTARNEPVIALLGRTFFKSLGLLALATGLATVAGIGIALVGQSNRASRWTRLPLVVSVGLLAMPSFLIGGLCQVINVEIAVRFGVPALPTIGAGWDAHLIMPALALAARPTAYVARITSRLLAETDGELFVRTARAKGLTDRLVLLRHTFRASATGVLAAVALGLRLAVGTLPVVEIVFVYPGMGSSFLASLRGGDVTATTGLALAIALTLWASSLAVDAARRRLDPRLAAVAMGIPL